MKSTPQNPETFESDQSGGARPARRMRAGQVLLSKTWDRKSCVQRTPGLHVWSRRISKAVWLAWSRGRRGHRGGSHRSPTVFHTSLRCGGGQFPGGCRPSHLANCGSIFEPSPREALEDVTVTLRTDLWPGEKYQVKV